MQRRIDISKFSQQESSQITTRVKSELQLIIDAAYLTKSKILLNLTSGGVVRYIQENHLKEWSVIDGFFYGEKHSWLELPCRLSLLDVTPINHNESLLYQTIKNGDPKPYGFRQCNLAYTQQELLQFLEQKEEIIETIEKARLQNIKTT